MTARKDGTLLYMSENTQPTRTAGSLDALVRSAATKTLHRLSRETVLMCGGMVSVEEWDAIKDVIAEEMDKLIAGEFTPAAGSGIGILRWYVVEGETGVTHQADGAKGLYTGVSRWHYSLKEARKELREWQRTRNGLHWARIVKIVETRKVLETKFPYHPVMKKRLKRKSPNPQAERPAEKETRDES